MTNKENNREKKFRFSSKSPSEVHLFFPEIEANSPPYTLEIADGGEDRACFTFDTVSSSGQNNRNFVFKLDGETQVVLDTQGPWIGRRSKQKLLGLLQCL